MTTIQEIKVMLFEARGWTRLEADLDNPDGDIFLSREISTKSGETETKTIKVTRSGNAYSKTTKKNSDAV